MARANASLTTIETFLNQKRIAMVGVSHNPNEIGASLYKEFVNRGYEVLIVNPNALELFGQKCYARVQDIKPVPTAALLLTSPKITESIVRDCSQAGVQTVWMFRGGGQGSVSPAAVEFCRKQGIDVVPGECPLMFLKPVRNVHWVHAVLRKLTGRYPRKVTAATA